MLSGTAESTKATNAVYRRLNEDMIEIYKVIRKVYDTEAAPIMPLTDQPLPAEIHTRCTVPHVNTNVMTAIVDIGNPRTIQMSNVISQ